LHKEYSMTAAHINDRFTTPTTTATLWLANGLFWFVFAWYCWLSWIFGPDFVTNTIGRDEAPGSYVLLVRVCEILCSGAGLLMIWYFVVRPKIRDGKFSFDGLFFLAAFMMYFQEPWLNYNGQQFMYNTVTINYGSWLGYIPGWNSPYPERIPVGGPLVAFAYIVYVGGAGFIGSKFMGWYKSKRPEVTHLKLIVVTFVFLVVADTLFESLLMRLNIMGYPSAVPELTLWAGEYYQLPIYQELQWAATFTAMACLHFFRDDRGYSLPERAVDQFNFGPRLKTFSRFLMMVGFLQVAFLITYNIPYFYWSTKGGAYPEALQSYRIGGLCGPETDFDCATLELPVPKANSPTNRIVPLQD
jgi:Spirocyclase AveC-like